MTEFIWDKDTENEMITDWIETEDIPKKLMNFLSCFRSNLCFHLGMSDTFMWDKNTENKRMTD